MFYEKMVICLKIIEKVIKKYYVYWEDYLFLLICMVLLLNCSYKYEIFKVVLCN